MHRTDVHLKIPKTDIHVSMYGRRENLTCAAVLSILYVRPSGYLTRTSVLSILHVRPSEYLT
jgi:hypothetical protein